LALLPRVGPWGPWWTLISAPSPPHWPGLPTISSRPFPSTLRSGQRRFPTLISDAEIVTLAVMEALLTYKSERRWLQIARPKLVVMFPHLPQQPGYNKRIRHLGQLMAWLNQ
jgi:hypothetical protein